MNNSSQRILKDVLLEYMESEAAQVPPTEVLMREHTFSERFLGKMKLLLAQEEKTARRRCSEKMTEQGERDEKAGFFRKISQSRIFFRVAAVCIVCVIAFGAGWMIYRGGGGLTSSDSAATDMAAVDSEMAAGSEEAAADSEEAVTEDTTDAAEGENLLTAQAETDLTDFNITVKSCSAYSMELELANETGAEITFGSYYVIEAYNEEAGTWAAADQIYDGTFEDLAYIIRDGETVTLTVNWSDLYGELGEGTWRLTKEIQSMEDEAFYSLTVTFEI